MFKKCTVFSTEKYWFNVVDRSYKAEKIVPSCAWTFCLDVSQAENKIKGIVMNDIFAAKASYPLWMQKIAIEWMRSVIWADSFELKHAWRF